MPSETYSAVFSVHDFKLPSWPMVDFHLPVVATELGGYVLQNITGADLQNTDNQTLENPH